MKIKENVLIKNESSFYEKLLLVQSEIEAVPEGLDNPFFKSKYADINVYLKVIKPILNRHGLILIQSHYTDQFGDFLKTVITDGNDEISSCTRIICSRQNDPQSYGAAITYSRRYGIQSILAVEAEDDDANSATFPAQKTEMQKTTKRY